MQYLPLVPWTFAEIFTLFNVALLVCSGAGMFIREGSTQLRALMSWLAIGVAVSSLAISVPIAASLIVAWWTGVPNEYLAFVNRAFGSWVWIYWIRIDIISLLPHLFWLKAIRGSPRVCLLLTAILLGVLIFAPLQLGLADSLLR